MVANVAVRAPKALVGHPRPRIAPPVPARSGSRAFADFSASIGIDLRPWQEMVARYLTAEDTAGRWLFRECAIIVARQNGKTTLLVPLILSRLLAGQRIMHTAQNRELPREVFGLVSDIIWKQYPHLLPLRNGRVVRPRFANGQEEIRLNNGGTYRIVAPTRGGARGPSNDLVIIDELREMVDHDFIAAAKPTLTASPKPQIVYLSNAGTDDSEVLNALKRRSGEDPALAYLEWSASPDRRTDDPAGWAEANPSIGHDPAVLLTLEDEYRANRLAGTLGIFETEHLCRWVQTLREPIVSAFDWTRCGPAELGIPRRPYMGIALDPEGKRASAAMAWRMPDNTVAMRILLDVTGSPIDTDTLGEALRDLAKRERIASTGFDPLTDAQLVKFLRKGSAQPIAGAKHANASARFAVAVASDRLRWEDADAVTDDLTWTTRKPHDESGSFQAVRADDERPITAALAAIRAVWLASTPPTSGARIW